MPSQPTVRRDEAVQTSVLVSIDMPGDHLDDVWSERGWSDGLPIRPPLVESVDAFIESSGMDRQETIGAVPPSGGIATVGNVAVNAFMAGCRSEHLKVVVAAVRALLVERFDLYSVQCTTNPVAPLLVVNGPVRNDCRIASGRGALGPGPHSNGVIGRAVRLVMGNLGGAFDADVDMATHGSPLKYAFCTGEAEEDSPWEPLHEWLGHDRASSVVTAIAVESLIEIVPSYGNTKAHHLIDHFGRAMRTLGTSYYWSRGNPVLIMNPTHVEILHTAGIGRADLQQILFHEARISLDSMPYGNIPVGDWVVEDGRVLGMERPEDIYLVAAGGVGGHHSLYGSGFCLSFASSAPVMT